MLPKFKKPVRCAPMILAVAVAIGALVVLIQPSRVVSASTAMVSHAGHLVDALPAGTQVAPVGPVPEDVPAEELAVAQVADQVGEQPEEP